MNMLIFLLAALLPAVVHASFRESTVFHPEHGAAPSRLRRRKGAVSFSSVDARASGEPVTNSEVFNPKLGGTNVPPRISNKIFCKQPDDVPACEGAGCCCWSTFGLPHHPAYPNPDEGQVKRKCSNPPPKHVYVVVPGEVGDNGEDEAIKEDSAIPVYDGRNLCCAIPEESPEYYSQRDVLEAVPTTVPPPTTTKAPTTTTTTPAPTTTNPYEDYESMKMEEAATANAESAAELHDASDMLNQTVNELHDTIEAQGRDPRLGIHYANIARMEKAVHVYNSKEWENMQKYHEAASFEHEDHAFAAHKAKQEAEAKAKAEAEAAAKAAAEAAARGPAPGPAAPPAAAPAAKPPA